MHKTIMLELNRDFIKGFIKKNYYKKPELRKSNVNKLLNKWLLCVLMIGYT